VLVHGGSDGNWLAWAVLFPKAGTGALVVANATAAGNAPETGSRKRIRFICRIKQMNLTLGGRAVDGR